MWKEVNIMKNYFPLSVKAKGSIGNLIVSLIILILLQERGLAAVIGWYIILSVLTKGQH